MTRRRSGGLLTVWAAVGGVMATGVVLASPDVPLAIRGPALQAVIETVGGIATLSAALMVYGRFRMLPTVGVGTLLAALLTFGLTNLVLAAAPAAIATMNPSYDTWGALAGRLVATLLFAAAAFLGDDRRIPLIAPVLLAIGVVGAAVVMSATVGPDLPTAVELTDAVTRADDLESHRAVLLLNALGLVAFLLAAVGYGRREDVFYRALGAASVLAAFSRLHLMLVPSLYSGTVYSGDVFRLAFHATVLIAALDEVRRYWQDREALAIAEERRRVARDLHDGVAQELAFISSTTTRLAATREQQDIVLIASVARRALDESRRAIATLSRPLDEPLHAVLADTLNERAAALGASFDLSSRPGGGTTIVVTL